MFENLTERLSGIFENLRRRGRLSDADVDAAMREVRLALLEADVHYGVVKQFTNRVKERAVGHDISRALNPAQQVIKIVNEELIQTLGPPSSLNLKGERPYVIVLVGLQGSGKTTAAAKLAKRLRAMGERTLLVAADPYRPAAVTQLQTLAEQIGVPVFHDADLTPPKLAEKAYQTALKGGVSVVILDTAGRSQMDQELMDELRAIEKKVPVTETILVVDAMIGQEALNVAQGFRQALPLSGLFLTKIDGDARGGAAISIREVTGIPIKFLGVGESIDAIEEYNPDRLASRILGMGDLLGLIEKAESAFDQQEAEEQAEKLMRGEFTLEDFARQLKQMRKMGPLAQVMEMLPGQMGQVARQVDPREAEDQLKQIEAVINSMTVAERRSPKILNASRRRRIARGSGLEVQVVNQVMKRFRETQRLISTLQKSGGKGLGRLMG
ncbi:MAG TPA: signal recognition particle protein [Brevefilum sp.]|nr:signal recognition particle protein [Brevefilum sp.]HOR20132.1 signal recognition particle protein [Brevefilum sp.]HPL70171.1 signal recognition particle protein [Brevefilum sp.]